jgi:hypothetical protein
MKLDKPRRLDLGEEGMEHAGICECIQKQFVAVLCYSYTYCMVFMK